MKRILFVCIENSCRSQIAEGFANKFGHDIVEAWSAGSKPSGKVNEMAIALMKERDIEIGARGSKSLADIPAGTWDYVVTMGCGDACPFVPARNRLDWNIPDPKNMPRPEFHKVIDQIDQAVTQLLHQAISQG